MLRIKYGNLKANYRAINMKKSKLGGASNFGTKQMSCKQGSTDSNFCSDFTNDENNLGEQSSLSIKSSFQSTIGTSKLSHDSQSRRLT